MAATNAFFVWYFLIGFGGIGGWFLFLLVALIGIIWLLYDSSKRDLNVAGWKMAVVLTTLLLIPTIFYRFSAVAQATLSPSLLEVFFYLGVLGGLLPLVIAIGYYVTFRGVTGSGVEMPPPPAYAPPPAPMPMAEPVRRAAPMPPAKPKANAWLVASDGRNHELYIGETTIGRSSQNDIQISSDTTVSNRHAKITESNGHFRFVDVGSTNGSKVNGRRVREPVLLASDDTVQLGDHTSFRFVTARK